MRSSISRALAISFAFVATRASASPVESDIDRCSDVPDSEGLPCHCLADVQEGAFAWTDVRGAMHVSSRLTTVPEPFSSMYRALHRDATGAVTFDDGRPAENLEVGFDSSPYTLALVASRRSLRESVAAARAELYAATRAYVATLAQSCSVGVNPVLRAVKMSPAASCDLDAPACSVADAARRTAVARARLLVDLPSWSKAHGLPAALLQ